MAECCPSIFPEIPSAPYLRVHVLPVEAEHRDRRLDAPLAAESERNETRSLRSLLFQQFVTFSYTPILIDLWKSLTVLIVFSMVLTDMSRDLYKLRGESLSPEIHIQTVCGPVVCHPIQEIISWMDLQGLGLPGLSQPLHRGGPAYADSRGQARCLSAWSVQGSIPYRFPKRSITNPTLVIPSMFFVQVFTLFWRVYYLIICT